MSVINTEDAIKARKCICEDTVHAIAKFLGHIEDDEKLLEVLCMACVANVEGGAKYDDIQRVYDWFHDAVKRLHLLQGHLQGLYNVEVSEDGETNIRLSDVALALDGGSQDNTDHIMAEFERHGGWLGICQSSS